MNEGNKIVKVEFYGQEAQSLCWNLYKNGDRHLEWLFIGCNDILLNLNIYDNWRWFVKFEEEEGETDLEFLWLSGWWAIMDEQAKSNSNANKPTNPSIFDFDIPIFENVKY